MGFTGDTNGKEAPASSGDIRDTGSIPGLGRSPGRENGNPLQYSCLENLMDSGKCRLQSIGFQRVGWFTERGEREATLVAQW